LVCWKASGANFEQEGYTPSDRWGFGFIVKDLQRGDFATSCKITTGASRFNRGSCGCRNPKQEEEKGLLRKVMMGGP